MSSMSSPWQQPKILAHSQLLLASYFHWVKRPLLPDLNPETMNPEAIAQALFLAPFVVVSHGTEADPIFNYGNNKALELWELTWDELTAMPSRKTVAADEEQNRETLIQSGRSQGYIDHYAGIRRTSTGKRFRIEDVILWNVVDSQGHYHGQAATFCHYEFLAEIP